MDLKTFLLETWNIHESRHGDDLIYVGHDQENRWSVFFSGRERVLGAVNTLAQAQMAAHWLFDSGKNCSIKLEWRLIPESEIKDLTK